MAAGFSAATAFTAILFLFPAFAGTVLAKAEANLFAKARSVSPRVGSASPRRASKWPRRNPSAVWRFEAASIGRQGIIVPFGPPPPRHFHHPLTAWLSLRRSLP
jgi:hypothetical protein